MRKSSIIIACLIILIFLSITFFSMTMAYSVISNFQESDVYTQVSFSEDVKLGITVMFYFLFSKESIKKIFVKKEL
jgi:phosphatidylglycerophosphate synthase